MLNCTVLILHQIIETYICIEKVWNKNNHMRTVLLGDLIFLFSPWISKFSSMNMYFFIIGKNIKVKFQTQNNMVFVVWSPLWLVWSWTFLGLRGRVGKHCRPRTLEPDYSGSNSGCPSSCWHGWSDPLSLSVPQFLQLWSEDGSSTCWES